MDGAARWVRLDVAVSAHDVGLVKAVAAVLRAGGDEAMRVGDALASMTAIEAARTGAELLAFLRASPLGGEVLSIKREGATARVVDLE